MTTLNGIMMLAWLKKMPALSKLEICRKMQPYVVLYQLSLCEGEICFPEEISVSQHAILIKHASGIYEKGIPFQSIIGIEEFRSEIEVFLRTGHVFTFKRSGALWNVYNFYSYGEPSRIKVWFRKMVGKTGCFL